MRAFIDTSAILRLLVKDDEFKARAVENLIRSAPERGITLHVLPVTMMEIVWVLEKVYHKPKPAIRELAEAIINTPQLKVEMSAVFLQAMKLYTEKNVALADALMGCWGLSLGLDTAFTYDEKHFKRIDGLAVKRPH